jgi:hypothetical protein
MTLCVFLAETALFLPTLKRTIVCTAMPATVNAVIVGLAPGANPTIVSYNVSVVNFYNATGSLARLENKNISFYFEKRSSLLLEVGRN